MKYRYYTCDVFTEQRFGGNPLAVVPHADGLSAEQMQHIAREFNYSESAFVFPAEAGHTRKVRLFTPACEVPFAGHPNVGTAFVLASIGEFGEIQSARSVTFEEKAGLVPIHIQAANKKVLSCELTAPEPLFLGPTLPATLVASAVSLREDDFVTQAHPPQVASVGLPFVIAEVASVAALQRVRVQLKGFEEIRAALSGEGLRASVYLYARTSGEVDLQARMLAPLSGVMEDPATGSASCAVTGLLAHLDKQTSGSYSFRIAQGVEMGRPSLLNTRAEKAHGVVRATRVGGACVLVSEGFLMMD